MRRTSFRGLMSVAFAVGLTACAPRTSELDGDWLVQRIAGAPLAAQETISFSIDTRAQLLRGYTGCNPFSASIREFEGALSISNIIEDDAPCPSPAAQTNETRLLAVLPSVVRYARHGASMELLARDPQPDALLLLRSDNLASPAG